VENAQFRGQGTAKGTASVVLRGPEDEDVEAGATNPCSTVEERRLSAASNALNVTGLQPPASLTRPLHRRVKRS
jgi:hypothetical protein